MKKCLTSAFLVLFLASSCYSNPLIRFEKTEHDFGNVIQGNVVKVVFTFTNAGGSKLVVEKIESG
jgi:hypothetical protein